MCTVSWLHHDHGYQLLCNRDEKNTRRPAEAPRVRMASGVRYVAPSDGDHGGTWIATNEFGLTLALLNRPGLPPFGARSRGLLVTSLVSASALEEVTAKLTGQSLSRYAPFALVALEPGMPAALFEWDGKRLTRTANAEHRMPLTSSSFDAAGAEAARRAELLTRAEASGGLDASVLFEFHQSHGIEGGQPNAYTTCMHRADARTVSFTCVDVSDSHAVFFYSPAPPCQWAPGQTVQLARVARLAACG